MDKVKSISHLVNVFFYTYANFAFGNTVCLILCFVLVQLVFCLMS